MQPLHTPNKARGETQIGQPFRITRAVSIGSSIEHKPFIDLSLVRDHVKHSGIQYTNPNHGAGTVPSMHTDIVAADVPHDIVIVPSSVASSVASVPSLYAALN